MCAKNSPYKEVMKQDSKAETVILPYLENLPINWLKMAEFSWLVEVLNDCFTAKTERDTVQVFCRINQVATRNYIRFFNHGFVPLDLPSTIDQKCELYCRDLSMTLNNRAVINFIRKMPFDWLVNIDYQNNKTIAEFQ